MEIFLLFAGVAGLGAYVAAMTLPVVWQDWENWVFDREVLGEPATFSGYWNAKQQRITGTLSAWLGLAPAPPKADTSPGSASPDSPRRGPAGVRNNALIGRLAIPRLRLTSIVREGVGESTLGLAVGHIPGTALPGQNGNVGVAGHRDTLFRGLGAVRNNDLIQLETLDGSYTYEVASTQIVKPRNVSVLKAGRYRELTLVTCYPFNYIGSAPDRFVVKARQIASNVRSSVRPVAMTTTPEPEVHPRAAIAPPVRGRINFSLSRGHSRTLAPGISIGVDNTNVDDQRMNGWMWVMPDRRTVWLRDQGTHVPVVFYGAEDGKKRELWITTVTETSVTGYLILPPM
jgi:sortase A